MHTYTAIVETTPASVLNRRGVGKAAWRNVIENLIFSEREDLKDLQRLQTKLGADPEAMKILQDMQARKTIRIIELNDLMHYRDKEARPRD